MSLISRVFGPKFSVVIPVLNESDKDINSCIDGVLSVRKDNIEVLVVDGASKVKPRIDSRAKLIVSESPEEQMADVLNAVRGRIFCFVHADVAIPKNYFTEIEKALEEGADYGACHIAYNKKGFWISIARFFANSISKLVHFSPGDNAPFFKMDALKKAGFVNSNVLIWSSLVSRKMIFGRFKFKVLDCSVVSSARRFERSSLAKVFLGWLLVCAHPFFFGLNHNPFLRIYRKL